MHDTLQNTHIAIIYINHMVIGFQMFSMKVGSAKSSSAEVYLKDENPALWQHVQKYSVPDTASGMRMLRYTIQFTKKQ